MRAQGHALNKTTIARWSQGFISGTSIAAGTTAMLAEIKTTAAR